MRSLKRLRSVAHGIADHAVSGLSYVHPHLGQLCTNLKHDLAGIDLLDGTVELPQAMVPKPLRLAAGALREKFVAILGAEGFEPSELRSARIIFQFSEGEWPSGSYVRIVTRDAREVEAAVGPDGRKAEVLRTI